MITYWLCLNVADVVSSLSFLELGHGEGNQIMSGMGSVEFVVYKVAMTLIVLALLWRVKRQHLLKLCNVGLGFVVLWNSVWMVVS